MPDEGRQSTFSTIAGHRRSDLGRQRHVCAEHDVFATATCYASATGRGRPIGAVRAERKYKVVAANLIKEAIHKIYCRNLIHEL